MERQKHGKYYWERVRIFRLTTHLGVTLTIDIC